MRTGSDQRPRGRYNGNRPFQQQQRPPQQQRNQSFDSNGPNIKIRGSAYQIFERYVALAREAAIGGDRIAAENFYQHAEHYFRIANASREGSQPGTPQRPTTPADLEMNPTEAGSSEAQGERSQPWRDEDDPDSSEPSIR
jgi:hypothetical protein